MAKMVAVLWSQSMYLPFYRGFGCSGSAAGAVTAVSHCCRGVLLRWAPGCIESRSAPRRATQM
jgi:hypothetical protein